jgi:hypothetical protein
MREVISIRFDRLPPPGRFCLTAAIMAKRDTVRNVKID